MKSKSFGALVVLVVSAANCPAETVLVEEMIGDAVCELIIGVTRDPQFGLALIVGAGGILTELLQDTATMLLPASRSDMERALKSLKIARLIHGFRGKSADLEAALDAIQTIARFAADHATTLEELDINPLIVLEPGKGAIAADALIRIRKD